jgi:hypothetical protein
MKQRRATSGSSECDRAVHDAAAQGSSAGASGCSGDNGSRSSSLSSYLCRPVGAFLSDAPKKTAPPRGARVECYGPPFGMSPLNLSPSPRRVSSLGHGALTVIFSSSLVSRIGPNETAARAFNEVDARPRGEVLLSENRSRAPFGQGTAGSNEVPVDACGRVADRFRRRHFDAAPTTPDGARAPIEGRSRRTLGGEAQPWGKCNRAVEPY